MCENNGVFTYLKTHSNSLHFGWKVILGKFPTKVPLCRRKVAEGDLKCVMCKEKDETISHLFLNCTVVKRI